MVKFKAKPRVRNTEVPAIITEFAAKAKLFETTTLHEADKKMSDEFVAACLTLNHVTITRLHHQYPAIFSTKDLSAFIIDEPPPTPFPERMKEIFDQIIPGQHELKVLDRECTGCSLGGWTKVFVVSDKNKPGWQTHFGFLIKVVDDRITEIYECSQYKMYQDKLSKRMFAGMSEQEIAEAKKSFESFPDLRKRKSPF